MRPAFIIFVCYFIAVKAGSLPSNLDFFKSNENLKYDSTDEKKLSSDKVFPSIDTANNNPKVDAVSSQKEVAIPKADTFKGDNTSNNDANKPEIYTDRQITEDSSNRNNASLSTTKSDHVVVNSIVVDAAPTSNTKNATTRDGKNITHGEVPGDNPTSKTNTREDGDDKTGGHKQQDTSVPTLHTDRDQNATKNEDATKDENATKSTGNAKDSGTLLTTGTNSLKTADQEKSNIPKTVTISDPSRPPVDNNEPAVDAITEKMQNSSASVTEKETTGKKNESLHPTTDHNSQPVVGIAAITPTEMDESIENERTTPSNQPTDEETMEENRKEVTEKDESLENEVTNPSNQPTEKDKSLENEGTNPSNQPTGEGTEEENYKEDPDFNGAAGGDDNPTETENSDLDVNDNSNLIAENPEGPTEEDFENGIEYGDMEEDESANADGKKISLVGLDNSEEKKELTLPKRPKPISNAGGVYETLDVEIDDEPSSNFFTFILFAMFFTAMLYLLYHNKRKVMAYIRPGPNQRKTGSRFRGKYDRLENQSDDRAYRL